MSVTPDRWWRAGLIEMIVYGFAVAGAIASHGLFALRGLVPEPTAGRVREMAPFRIDYVFILNLAARLITAGLLWRPFDSDPRRKLRVAESAQAEIDYASHAALAVSPERLEDLLPGSRPRLLHHQRPRRGRRRTPAIVRV